MKVITKILVPTDGSKTALKSVQYAAELARQTGATVTLLSVIEKGFFVAQSIPSAIAPTHLIEPIEDYMRQSAETFLEAAAKTVGKHGVKTKTVIRSGHPVEEIMKEAEKSKVDLIVMGSHGKSALKAAVLGSVSFGIIHKDTKIPVLLVRK